MGHINIVTNSLEELRPALGALGVWKASSLKSLLEPDESEASREEPASEDPQSADPQPEDVQTPDPQQEDQNSEESN